GPRARRRGRRHAHRAGLTGRRCRRHRRRRHGECHPRPHRGLIQGQSMELGMIGLGRMGANMTERLLRGGHRVVGYDHDPAATARVVASGAVGAASLEELVAALARPRAVWMMVPAGAPVDETIAALRPWLASGDVLIDGGNSHYRDSMRRGRALAQEGLAFVDVGTSGGIWGLSEGYSLMIGGEPEPVQRLTSLFTTLAPAPDRG